MAARQKKLVVALLAALLLGWADLVSSAEPAQRVVSLVPNVTEMLFAVGAGSQVCDAFRNVRRSAGAREKPVVP